MKPADDYIAYTIEQHGRCWVILGLWLNGCTLDNEIVWQSADGADEMIAKEKLAGINKACADEIIDLYRRHSEKVEEANQNSQF